MTQWLDYHMSNFEKYNIGNMWYTGVQNNQRSYGIFDSEFGWNPTILDKLTGVSQPETPHTSQIIDSEFLEPGLAWLLTSEKITKKCVYGSEAFSGNSMIKIQVPQDAEGQLYQQTYRGDGEYKGAPGRTLLHLIKGQTYRISFIAASENGKGRMKVILRDAVSMTSIYDSFETDGEWIKIGKEPKTYTQLYTHNAKTEMDVRLELDVGSKKQVIYLDKVKLIRN